MRALIKSIVSAMTLTALCTANTSAIAANSDITSSVVSAADAEKNDEILDNSSMGVKEGYYYHLISCSAEDEMELISPSLFKAKWNSTDAKYTRAPVFERGIESVSGDDSSWISNSSVDYEMDVNAEGSYFIGTHASFTGEETEDYYRNIDLYIIDAAVNWEVPEDAVYLNDASEKGNEYDIYQSEKTLAGTGKAVTNDTYYVINKKADINGKNGKISANYDLAPFMFCMWNPYPITPVYLCTGINGGVSKGSAEMIRNNITVPGKEMLSNEHEHTENLIDLNTDRHLVNVYDKEIDKTRYSAFGYDMEMKGYAGEPIKCTWKYYEYGSDDEHLFDQFRTSDFSVWHSLSSYSRADQQGCLYYNDTDELALEYSIDIGDITKKTTDSRWYTGATVQCMRNVPAQPSSSDPLGGDSISYILLYDKTENFDMLRDYDRDLYRTPVEMGTVSSDGVEYEVWFSETVDIFAHPTVYVIRKDELESVTADNIPAGYTRYENSFSITDIFTKLKDVGLDLGNIGDIAFALTAYDTAGSAYINKADIKRTIPESKTFSADDFQLLKDYVMGKGNEIPDCADYIYHDYLAMDLRKYLSRMQKNYDINGDGEWDIYDLCEMRKRLSDYDPEPYVKPDDIVKFGSYMTVSVDSLQLYRGPDESYECITSIPRNARLKELGVQPDNNYWFFTEYNGHYGWTKAVEITDFTSLVDSGNYDYKPVIYLYPEEETDVHVELELTESELYTTYPKYNNGWDVTAYPDGSLLNKADGTQHKYLFWDSCNCRTRYDFSKGFCVAGSDTESFLKETLTYMGLTEEEMNEFIVYWLPLMEHNMYNLITFQSDAYTNSAKLDITPKPDSMLRIFMVYVPLEEAVNMEPQQLETFERKGFTVVEWGGSIIEP